MVKNLPYWWCHPWKTQNEQIFLHCKLEDLPSLLRDWIDLLHNLLASYGFAKWCELAAQCLISKYDILVYWLPIRYAVFIIISIPKLQGNPQFTMNRILKDAVKEHVVGVCQQSLFFEKFATTHLPQVLIHQPLLPN